MVALVARLMRRAARTHRMRIAIVWGAVVLGAGVAVGGYLVNRVLVVTTSRG